MVLGANPKAFGFVNVDRQRPGTAEHWINEEKNAVNGTRLSWRDLPDN